MGGLTAMPLADRDPIRVVGFVDIAGNLALEDWFHTGQTVSHPHQDSQGFLAACFGDHVLEELSEHRYQLLDRLAAASGPTVDWACGMRPAGRSWAGLT